MSARPDEPANKPRWGRLKALWNKERPVSNRAQIVSAIFAGTSFLLALLAFCAVLYQVTTIKHNAATANARQVFMEYSKAGMKYPMFAYPDYDKLKAGDQFNRYKLFVILMLWAYDEMLLVYDDPEWNISFTADIQGHLPYMCAETKFPDDYLTLSKKMQSLVVKVMEACPAKK